MYKILAVLTVILLSGCALPMTITMGVGAASVAVNEATGKTATDHVVSVVNSRDCRVSRIGKEDICQDEQAPIKVKIVTTNVKPSSVEEIESKYR